MLCNYVLQQFIHQAEKMMKATAVSILLLLLVKFPSSLSMPTNCTQASASETRCTVLLVEEASSNVLVFDTTMYLTCGNCLVSSTPEFLYNNHFKQDQSKRIFTKVHIDRESMVARTTAPLPVIMNVVVLDLSTNNRIIIDIHIVDLNDNIPQFTSGGMALPDTMAKSVPEGPTVGKLIIALEAVDYDEGLNGTSSYILEQSDPPFFSLQVTNASGRASIASISNIKPLDREMNESFTLRIIALEGTTNPHNDTLTLIITIIDVDDNPPVFETTHYNVILPQWTMVGEELTTLTANDSDIGSNSNIEYTIKNVCAELNPPDGDCVAVPQSGWPFSLDPQMGILTLSHFVSCMLADYRVIVNAANPSNPHGGLATAIVWIQTVAHPQDNDSPIVPSQSSSLVTTTSISSKSTKLSSVLESTITTQSSTVVSAPKPTLTPVVDQQCDDRIVDYCLTAGAGGIALLFLSLFFNIVLLATIISTKRRKKSVNLDVFEKKEHNRVLPPPPSPSPTYSGSIVKSHSSANTAEYDTVDYEHVEIINVIYESVDDHKLTETSV